jgi:hypothetical protein
MSYAPLSFVAFLRRFTQFLIVLPLLAAGCSTGAYRLDSKAEDCKDTGLTIHENISIARQQAAMFGLNGCLPRSVILPNQEALVRVICPKPDGSWASLGDLTNDKKSCELARVHLAKYPGLALEARPGDQPFQQSGAASKLWVVDPTEETCRLVPFDRVDELAGMFQRETGLYCEVRPNEIQDDRFYTIICGGMGGKAWIVTENIEICRRALDGYKKRE